ncbi:MAG: hypothetical protein QNJ30_08430 [Kiloniellales bacterium]|nr:hypothetical protein [Kiloniellales bacterium]
MTGDNAHGGFSLARWRDLMSALDLGEQDETYAALAEAYGARGRHYHTQDHIAACLALLDDYADLAAKPAEAELALWFHDAVYSTKAFDNEAKSADWAAEFLAEAGAEAPVADRVATHVRATKHDDTPPSGDSALVVDIDLSILGREPEIFDAFDRAIRKEYSWVPGFLFRQKRRQLLQHLMERPVLYATPALRERFEAPARANLERALGRLAS